MTEAPPTLCTLSSPLHLSLRLAPGAANGPAYNAAYGPAHAAYRLAHSSGDGSAHETAPGPANDAYGSAYVAQGSSRPSGCGPAYSPAYSTAYGSASTNTFSSPTYGASATYTAPCRQMPAGHPSPWPPCPGTGLGYNRGSESAPDRLTAGACVATIHSALGIVCCYCFRHF